MQNHTDHIAPLTVLPEKSFRITIARPANNVESSSAAQLNSGEAVQPSVPVDVLRALHKNNERISEQIRRFSESLEGGERTLQLRIDPDRGDAYVVIVENDTGRILAKLSVGLSDFFGTHQSPGSLQESIV